jgi:hypothetical protein
MRLRRLCLLILALRFFRPHGIGVLLTVGLQDLSSVSYDNFDVESSHLFPAAPDE